MLGVALLSLELQVEAARVRCVCLGIACSQRYGETGGAWAIPADEQRQGELGGEARVNGVVGDGQDSSPEFLAADGARKRCRSRRSEALKN